MKKIILSKVILIVIMISIIFMSLCSCDITENATANKSQLENEYISITMYTYTPNIVIDENIDYLYYPYTIEVYGGHETFETKIIHKTLSQIDKTHKIYFNNKNHSLALEKDEILLPKWDYINLYCYGQEGFNIDEETAERIESDCDCYERYLYKYCPKEEKNFFIIDGSSAKRKADYEFHNRKSALTPASLVRYGLLDLNDVEYKDYIIRISYYEQNKGRLYDLKVVGYYESEVDTYLSKGFLRNSKEGQAIMEYTCEGKTLYTSENFPEGIELPKE